MRRALILLAITAGCSFPDPKIDDTVDLADSGQSEAAVDSMVDDTATEVGSDALTDAADAADARDSDSGDVQDVGVCETGDPCDCDGDGDKKPGPGCGGNDCDDGDPRRNSKVTMLQSYDATGLAHGGDWDCSMTVERELSQTGFACSGLSIGGTACSAAVGYKEAAPVCGKTATKVTCKVAVAVCVLDKETSVTVLCK